MLRNYSDKDFCMKNFSTNGPIYYLPPGLFEYLLVVSPGKEVYDKVIEEKRHFSRNYNQQVAVKTKPHITISCFLAWDSMEDTIVRWLQRIASEQKCFHVTLNNYSGIPSHTIYLRIQDSSAIDELKTRVKIIAPYIKEKDCAPSRPINYPHLSIAPHLPAGVYETAIKDYSEKEFHASFKVNELVLLKRKHQYDICSEAAVFRLQTGELNN
ncbi:MAG: 2'-5' RNA ligase family protein [Bacteroidetes bacterium]|nr:MAG: 2'-5' RNA ligase family protein [Bacteroidota bacterium]